MTKKRFSYHPDPPTTLPGGPPPPPPPGLTTQIPRGKSLIEFTSAYRFDDPILIDPDDVSFVKPLHTDRDLGSYSVIMLKCGVSLDVSGDVLTVGERIRKARQSQ